MKHKPFSLLLLLVSGLTVGLLVISCSQPKKEESKPKAQQPAIEQAKPETKPSTVSVDFDHAPLSNVVLMVTENTGKGFVLNGTEQTAISWTEYNIPREKLFNAFVNVLSSYKLNLKATSDQNTTYTISPMEEEKVPVQLQYATSRRGTFFLLGKTIYPKDQFPHQLSYEDGHWYALIPRSLAEQMNQTNANI